MADLNNERLACDVLIIGGGLVGASLALALAGSNLSVVIVEANQTETLQSQDFDGRSIALSDASQRILKSLQLWSELSFHATPIKKIHVSKKGQFGKTLLEAAKHHLAAFGYVAELSHLNQALQPRLFEQKNVQYLCPAKLLSLNSSGINALAIVQDKDLQIEINAKLVVAADGTNSFVRSLLNISPNQQDYQQSALVANIGLNRSHHYCAYERFSQDGLIALLPMTQQRASLVWALSPQKVKALCACSEAEFLVKLQQQFGYRLGKFTQVGKRHTFPLGLQSLAKPYEKNVVFVGNACQTLHPVAGQGFNLGLRDVAILAEVLMKTDAINNVDTLLNNYQQLRQADKHRMIMSTDQLVKFFGLNTFIFQAVQTMGLIATELVQPLKQTLVYHAMGYSAQNSKLACEIPL